jgi:hypothetical protein
MSRGGLNKADAARLREALGGLPEPLVYLRDAILDIAKQNQDMLGCGEADTKVFHRSWSKHAAADPAVDADADAEALQEWSDQHGRDNIWLGPVWFVVGLLRGISMYGAGGDDEDDVDEVLPPKVSLTVPANMKGKQSAYGWEINDRTVMIAVTPIDADLCRQMAEQYAAVAQMRLPETPEMANEVSKSFTLGSALGTRLVQTFQGNKKPFSACYALAVPGGHAIVQMVAKGRKKGIDLAKIEPMLATVRIDQ